MALLAVLVAWPALARAKGEVVFFALFSRGWEPYEMLVDGEPGGVSVDLFKALMPEDVHLVVEPMPAPRRSLSKPGTPIYTRLESRQWMADTYKYLWSEPVLEVKSVLCSPRDRPVVYRGPESLEGLTIGCIRNYLYPELHSLFESGRATRYDVNDEVLLLRMVQAGRVDVVLMDRLSMGWIIRHSPELDLDDFHMDGTPVSEDTIRFVFNMVPDWKPRLEELNRRIEEKRADGTIARIVHRYR